MANVSITARVASTHRMEKYGGVRLAGEVLHDMADRLNSGDVPMVFGHSALDRIEVENVRAEVTRLEDGEDALEATFDVDAIRWSEVQARFDEAGVPGGFSFTAGEPQIVPSGGEDAAISLSADAAAFTDADRERAWKMLSPVAPVRVNRLYQFAVEDLARVIVEMWPQLAVAVGINLISSALYDALGMLVGLSPEPTVVEMQRHYADGTHTTAVVTTDDPDVVRAALEQLEDQEQPEPLMWFDPDRGLWLPRQ